MATTAVYIFTKDRLELLRKVVPRWLEVAPFSTEIYLVADRSEAPVLRKNFSLIGVTILGLPRDNAGIGYARDYALRHAQRVGYRSILMSDDDVWPRPGADIQELLRLARLKKYLGIGMTHSYHDLLSDGATKDPANGLIFCPGGWGFNMFALNVHNAIKVGGFDPRLTCFGEDAELMRNGIANGFPWLVHCGIKFSQLGKRGEPGGIASLTGGISDVRMQQEQKCQFIINDRWPDFTTRPPKQSRMSWLKFYDHYMPDWRKKSFIHLGSLD